MRRAALCCLRQLSQKEAGEVCRYAMLAKDYVPAKPYCGIKIHALHLKMVESDLAFSESFYLYLSKLSSFFEEQKQCLLGNIFTILASYIVSSQYPVYISNEFIHRRSNNRNRLAGCAIRLSGHRARRNCTVLR